MIKRIIPNKKKIDIDKLTTEEVKDLVKKLVKKLDIKIEK